MHSGFARPIFCGLALVRRVLRPVFGGGRLGSAGALRAPRRVTAPVSIRWGSCRWSTPGLSRADRWSLRVPIVRCGGKRSLVVVPLTPEQQLTARDIQAQIDADATYRVRKHTVLISASR